MLKQADFFKNTAGLNLTDSPFFIQDGQASGGYNYDYVRTGGIQKVLGLSKINSNADTQLTSLGSGLHTQVANNIKTVIRAAGTKLQAFNPTSGTFTNQTEDTTIAGTDFLAAGTTQPVICTNFSAASSDQLWAAGGGLAQPTGYVTYVTNGEYTWVNSGAGSGLFVTGNVIAFTINGRAYSVPFLTNSLTTLTNAATAMAGDVDVGQAAVTDNLSTITFKGKNGKPLVLTAISVTGGATQPTVTVNTIVTASGSGVTSAHVTANGVAAPTGTFTAVNQGTSTGGFWGGATGNYYYAIALRKASTQALSNCALDVMVVIATATDSVLLTFPTGIDTIKYDKWYVYRSSVAGVMGFTAGTLVAQVKTTAATFVDTDLSLATSQLIPRAGNGLLDNSPLPSGTYNCVTMWKRRLVTAQNSTVYISDLNKPESWPTGLPITIPTGGAIRSVQTIGSNPTNSATPDEYLVVHKDTETWVITGDGSFSASTALYNTALQFVDYVGCSNAALCVKAAGFLAWVDTRGVYLWNGIAKPVYVSRPIEGWFGYDGGLDKTQLGVGFGVYYRKKNQIIWTLSDRTKGTNCIQLKLDLRLTASQMVNQYTQQLTNTVVEGVFNMDAHTTALYAGITYLPSTNQEAFVAFDNLGFAYNQYASVSDSGGGIGFNYTTKALDFGMPTISKQFSKVVVWVDSGAPGKNLTLKYWAGYRTLVTQESQQQRPMDVKTPAAVSRWDMGIWDKSLWDDYTSNIIPLVFNLDSSKNNNSGEALMLDFSQPEASAPVTIHGFSVFWDATNLHAS